MNRILPFIVWLALGIIGVLGAPNPNVSQFPAISLNAQTNILSMTNNQVTLDGVPMALGSNLWTQNGLALEPYTNTLTGIHFISSDTTAQFTLRENGGGFPVSALTGFAGADSIYLEADPTIDDSGTGLRITTASGTFTFQNGALTTLNPSGGTASPMKIGLNGSVPRLDLNGTGYDLTTGGTNFWTLTTTNMRPFQTTNFLQLGETTITNGSSTDTALTINQTSAGGVPFQINLGGTGKFTIAATSGNVTAQAINSGAITASSHIKATGGANIQTLSDAGIFALGLSADAWIGRAAAARPLVYGSTAAELDISDATYGGITDHRIGRIGFIQNANDLTLATENLNTFIGTGGRIVFAPLGTNTLIISTNQAVTITNAIAGTVPMTINHASGATADLFQSFVGGSARVSIQANGQVSFMGGTRINQLGTIVNAGDLNMASSSGIYWNSDTFLYRDAANTLQLGADAASVSDQAFKAADGSGTDKVGAKFTTEGGQSTGTAAAGAFDIATGLSAEASASTANSYSLRYHAKPKFVALTHATATEIEKFSLAANKILGGTMSVTCYATNSTPHAQSLTAELIFDAVAIGSTITGQVTNIALINLAAADSGTLTCAYTFVDNGDNTFSIKANANSSLASPIERARLVVTSLNGSNPITITDP